MPSETAFGYNEQTFRINLANNNVTVGYDLINYIYKISSSFSRHCGFVDNLHFNCPGNLFCTPLLLKTKYFLSLGKRQPASSPVVVFSGLVPVEILGLFVENFVGNPKPFQRRPIEVYSFIQSSLVLIHKKLQQLLDVDYFLATLSYLQDLLFDLFHAVHDRGVIAAAE